MLFGGFFVLLQLAQDQQGLKIRCSGNRHLNIALKVDFLGETYFTPYCMEIRNSY